MTEHDRAIGRLEGAFEEFRKWEADQHGEIKKDLAEIKTIVSRHEIKWARLGAYAVIAGTLGSGLFQVVIGFFKP